MLGPPGVGIQGNPGPPGLILFVEQPALNIPGFIQIPGGLIVPQVLYY